MPGERRAGRRHGIGCAFDVVRSGDLDTARPLQVQDVSPHGEKMTATNGAKEQDTGSLEGPSALAPGMWWGRVFPGEERQLGLLRRWLESLLPACPARDDVACVATELGTNAIVHTARSLTGDLVQVAGQAKSAQDRR